MPERPARVPAPVECWTVCAPHVKGTVPLARTAEAQGWDGVTLGDSQNRVGDVYVEMALAVAATEHLRLATWVTNPVTRHPSVTAGAIATLQEESGGRCELGIGRGDSALAYLGLAPASVDYLARYIERVQGYLARDAVPFAESDQGPGLAGLSSIEVGAVPTASRLEWLDPAVAKAPLFVAATGPRVIELAARSADAVVFSVGGDPGRLAWAIGVARDARSAAGLDPDDLVLGAHIPIGVHDDPATARALIASKVATHARISVMQGRLPGPSTPSLDADLAALRASYDMNHHAHHQSAQASAVTDQVASVWGIAGPPAYCTERLVELQELGITKFLLNNTFPGTEPADELASRTRLVEEVLPAFRAAVGRAAPA